MIWVVPVYSRDYLLFFSEICNTTEKEIIILSYLISTKEKIIQMILENLIRAKNRGVNIYMIVNGIFRNRETKRNQSVIAEKFRKAGIKTILNLRNSQDHRKIIIGDERKILIGSHNLTENSFYSAKELSLYIEDERLGKKLKEKIIEDYPVLFQ